jgi:hypothetical protein
MAAQWPLIANQLVALFPTLPSWTSAYSVYYGPPLDAGTTDTFVTVGYVVPLDGSSDIHAGTYSTTRDPDGFRWQETGSVNCELRAVTGDDTLLAMQTAAFAIANDFEQSFRTDRRLGGVLSVDSSVDTSVDVQSVANGGGAVQSLVLTLHYFTIT